MQTEVADTINDMGITMLGVDILPTELPVESSQHFGNKLMGVVEELIDAKASHYESKGFPTYALSHGVANAAITTANGHLARDYRYLQQLMNGAMGPVNVDLDRALLALRLEGHLFDSGLINQVLDTIEQSGYGVHLDEFVLPKHRPNTRIKSSILLTIFSKQSDESMVEELEQDLRTLVSGCVEAEATMAHVAVENRTNVIVTNGTPAPKVLVLGSGFMAHTAIESLAHSNVKITLVSNDANEAAKLASMYDNVDYVVLDVQADREHLSRLIGNVSVVLSLLPAPMHPLVAELCIAEKTHMVTSSYESNELRELEAEMKKAGIISLNEVGLDPGLDHMSAMKLIDDIHNRGGKVISFSSVCGGLPAPEVAQNNPFGYKFSWSPRGVLRASSAPARYCEDDRVVDVPGHQLLDQARPFAAAWPELQLEVLPNRDSTKYSEIYGIPNARTMFRGTLRYRGFSRLLSTLRNMGLLDEKYKVGETWYATMMDLVHRRGFQQLEDFALAAAVSSGFRISRRILARFFLTSYPYCSGRKH
jgi:alpha-aminoadipic semialdehyde synthase